MSDYHVLTVSRKNDAANVVFHVPVPSQMNFAGVNLQEALREYLQGNIEDGVIKSAYPRITAGELTDVQNGAIYEHVDTVRFSAHASKSEKRDAIDAQFNALKQRS